MIDVKPAYKFVTALAALAALLWQLDCHYDRKVAAAEKRIVVAMETYQDRADLRHYQQRTETLRDQVNYFQFIIQTEPNHPQVGIWKTKLRYYQKELDYSEGKLNELLNGR